MTDQPASGPLPELSSEQEATVRRLLAEARHDEPMPVEVSDRLDRVLADLSASAASSASPPTPVVDLAAHRRRRTAGRLLIAAAAVIVGGFAVGQVIDVGGSDSSDSGSDSAGSAVTREQSSDDQAGSAAPSAAGAPADSGAADAARADPLELSSQHLERDVQRQLKRSPANAELNPDSATLAPSYGVEFSCSPATPSAYGIGRLFPAFYDGMATVLALRPATGPTQEVQVLECGTGIPLRSVTVPVP